MLTMTHEELYQTVISKALEFGFLPKNAPSDTRQISNPKGDSVIRKNLTEESLKKGVRISDLYVRNRNSPAHTMIFRLSFFLTRT